MAVARDDDVGAFREACFEHPVIVASLLMIEALPAADDPSASRVRGAAASAVVVRTG